MQRKAIDVAVADAAQKSNPSEVGRCSQLEGDVWVPSSLADIAKRVPDLLGSSFIVDQKRHPAECRRFPQQLHQVP